MPAQRVLSDRVKAAVKTALAVVLAYGVALSMDWEKPYWAAFTVAFCSLATVGESLNKGLLRLSGTFLGGVAAITLIALFPQDRWLFLVGMSIFGGFCTLYDARTRLSQTRLASPRLRGELACAGPLCVNLSGEPSSSSDPSLPRFWVKRPRRSRSRHAC